MKIKMFYFMLLFLPFIFFSEATFAAGCTNNAGIKVVNVTSDLDVTGEAASNNVGHEFINAKTWSSGSGGVVTCQCVTATTSDDIAFGLKGETNLAFDVQKGKMKYYKINEYISVSTEIDSGYTSIPPAVVPFYGEDSLNFPCETSYDFGYSHIPGTAGSVSFYIRKLLIGKVIIPRTKVADVYLAFERNQWSNTPISQVYVSGSITVAQNCKVNNDQVINVPFGDINSGDIKSKDVSPSGAVVKKLQLSLDCNGITNGITVDLSIQGTADTNDTTALKTTQANSKLGIKFSNNLNAVVPVNTGRFPVVFDYATQKGNAEINIYPIMTTVSAPAAGLFNASATVRVELQ